MGRKFFHLGGSRGLEDGHWSSKLLEKSLDMEGDFSQPLGGEIWEFFHDVEKVWIEIPALLKPGAS